MKNLLVPIIGLLIAAVPLRAQTVESLLLPDHLDSRPTAARLAARIAELNREATLQTNLGNTAAATAINTVVSNLQSLQSGATPIPPSATPEVHAVSFYEGSPGQPRTARIQVTRVGAPIILFLTAYDPITWTIDPLPPGVQLQQVYLASYDPQVLNGVPPGVPVTTVSHASGGGTWYGDPTDLEGRVDAALHSFVQFGQFPTTFTGSYTAPAGPHEVGPGSTEWRDQWVLAMAVAEGQARNVGTRSALINGFGGQTFFPLMTPPMLSFGSASLVVASPLGVLSGPIVSVSGISQYAVGAGPTAFVLTNPGRDPSILDLGTLASSPIPPDPMLPAFSWVNGITYDAVRNRLLCISFGGAGYLYAYDVAFSTWSVVNSANNVDYGTIVYHPQYDAIFGLETPFGGSGAFRLRQLDASGNAVATRTLGLKTWGNLTDNFQLYTLGTNVVLVGPGKSVFGTALRHVFVIDPLTGDIVFAGFFVG